jgi:hypothetical protein
MGWRTDFTFSALRWAIVILPSLEHREFQPPLRPITSGIGQKVSELPSTLVLSLELPIAVINDIAQEQHVTRFLDEVTSQLFRPASRVNHIHLAITGQATLVVYILSPVIANLQKEADRVTRNVRKVIRLQTT